MTKRLMQIGNSLALVIDKPLLEILHIDKDTDLDLSTDGTRLTIAPVRRKSDRMAFEDSLSDVFKRHAPVFAKLAKSR